MKGLLRKLRVLREVKIFTKAESCSATPSARKVSAELPPKEKRAGCTGLANCTSRGPQCPGALFLHMLLCSAICAAIALPSIAPEEDVHHPLPPSRRRILYLFCARRAILKANGKRKAINVVQLKPCTAAATRNLRLAEA